MYSWQYNGVAPWFEIIDWCYTMFSAKSIWHQYETIHFQQEGDYVLFLLRWS